MSLIGFFIMGYFGVGLLRSPTHTHALATPLDCRIPFVEVSVWAYLWVFPSALIPLFVVKCPRLFRRTAIAYAAVMAVSFISFAVFPVNSVELRVGRATLDLSRPSGWAVSVLYFLDPPYNLFPSLHLSIATLAAFSAWKARKAYGVPLFACAGLVAASVCTVKQHYLVDVLGGLALAVLAGTLILGPYRPPYGDTPAYSWRGPVLYLAFVVIVYASLYVAYLLRS